MKEIVLKLVATNSGWIARRIIMYLAVAFATVTTWLVTKGVSAETAEVISAAVASMVFGVLELSLSWVARKYSVPEANGLKIDIGKLRGKGLMLMGGLCALCLASCVNDRFLGLTSDQWLDVGKEAGEAAFKAGASQGLTSYGTRRLTSAKDVIGVNP